MTRKRRRLMLVMAGLACLGGATALVLSALGDTLVYFYSPGELASKHVGPNTQVRIGGLVEQGSLTRKGRGGVFSSRFCVHVNFTLLRPGTLAVRLRGCCRRCLLGPNRRRRGLLGLVGTVPLPQPLHWFGWPPSHCLSLIRLAGCPASVPLSLLRRPQQPGQPACACRDPGVRGVVNLRLITPEPEM